LRGSPPDVQRRTGQSELTHLIDRIPSDFRRTAANLVGGGEECAT
jgi:hypothetical protein